MRIFENLNFDFLGKRKIAYTISAALFALGIIGVISRGFHFGVDFKGGSEIVLQFENPVDITKVREDVANIGLGNIEVVTFGGETGVMIRTEEQVIPANIFPVVVNRIEQAIDKVFQDVPRQIVDSTASSVTYSFENTDTTNRVS